MSQPVPPKGVITMSIWKTRKTPNCVRGKSEALWTEPHCDELNRPKDFLACPRFGSPHQ